MGWLGQSEYNCPKCDGEKRVVCSKCGDDPKCDYCEGTGWDPKQVDIAAFRAAEEKMHQTARDDGCAMLSSEGIDQKTNTRWGRNGGRYGNVAVIDFLRNH